jgi:hypothetical protein
MAKSFIIALEGPALTWYSMSPPLSIDSWKTLRDKFLFNFQGYMLETEVLVELFLYKKQEKESLHNYYKKFLLLKSQLPSIDDMIVIHYTISGHRVGQLYSHCTRDPPSNLQELYQFFEKYASLRNSIKERWSRSESQRRLYSPIGRGSGVHSKITLIKSTTDSSKSIT